MIATASVGTFAYQPAGHCMRLVPAARHTNSPALLLSDDSFFHAGLFGLATYSALRVFGESSPPALHP